VTMRNYKLQVANQGSTNDNRTNKGCASLVPVGLVSLNVLKVGACSKLALSTRAAVYLALNYLIRRRPISTDQLVRRLFGEPTAGKPVGAEHALREVSRLPMARPSIAVPLRKERSCTASLRD